MNAIKKLLNYIRETNELEHMINILDWEIKVVAPPLANYDMLKEKNKLEERVFKRKISKKFGFLLEEALASCEYELLEDAEKRYIKHAYKSRNKLLLVPPKIYIKRNKLISESVKKWEEAKKANDYEIFKPYLKELVDSTKEYYSFIARDKNIYDTMLEEYEEGFDTKKIDKLFKEIKMELLPILKKYNNKKSTGYLEKQKYSDEVLISVAKYLLDYVGFDLNRGTVGIYEHGFTSKIGSNDVRIAFNKTDDAATFVTTVIHEAGHGIFEQSIKSNLSQYESSSLDRFYGLHESQSRFFENILGRNKNFWIPIYDKIKDSLNFDISLDEFINILNRVKPGAIRTDADELSYCFHIIIRYEIEKGLFSGKLSVDDIPKVWNEKMQEYLGVKIFEDQDGLLQDIHWAEGSFGYFPSYLLGTIYDGLLLEAVTKEIGPIDRILKESRIKEITYFLKDNIYQYGGAYNSNDVINRICNRDIDVMPIIEYYKSKFNT